MSFTDPRYTENRVFSPYSTRSDTRPDWTEAWSLQHRDTFGCFVTNALAPGRVPMFVPLVAHGTREHILQVQGKL